jgi:uncharacterized protein YrrD
VTADWSDPVSDLEGIERALHEAHGFLVDAEDGTEVGIVDDVTLDESGRVVQIDVCGGWFGRRRLSFEVGDVLSVSPARRRIVVSHAAARRSSAPLSLLWK